MSQIVLYFLHSAPILSFYIDVVLTLYIGPNARSAEGLLSNRPVQIFKLNFDSPIGLIVA